MSLAAPRLRPHGHRLRRGAGLGGQAPPPLHPIQLPPVPPLQRISVRFEATGSQAAEVRIEGVRGSFRIRAPRIDVVRLGTQAVPVENGKYFAGLSDLFAGSIHHGYNFVLFTNTGEFISKAFVHRESGHCEKVSQSASQTLRWYSSFPEISLKRIDGQISQINVTPFYHNAKPCELSIGEHLISDTP